MSSQKLTVLQEVYCEQILNPTSVEAPTTQALAALLMELVDADAAVAAEASALGAVQRESVAAATMASIELDAKTSATPLDFAVMISVVQAYRSSIVNSLKN